MTQYHDYYLSIETEAAMIAALAAAGAAQLLPEILDDEGSVIRPETLQPAKGVNLHVIGSWADTDPVTLEPVTVPGWHFNVRSVEPIDWPEGVTVSNPATPWCVWAS